MTFIIYCARVLVPLMVVAVAVGVGMVLALLEVQQTVALFLFGGAILLIIGMLLGVVLGSRA